MKKTNTAALPLAFFWILMAIFFSNCQQSVTKSIKIATGPAGTSNYEIGNIIIDVLSENPRYRIKSVTKEEGSLARVNAMLEERTDFALIQNDLHLPDSIAAEIRTVTPLYPQVLFILFDSSITAKNLPDLVHGRRIGVGPRHSGVQGFVKNMLHEFHVDTNQCRFIYTSYDKNKIGDSIDVSCALTGFNNPSITQQIDEKRAQIWSFDPVEQLGHGASTEGFCMKYPYAMPYILPVRLYRDYPDKPLLTLAVSNVLVTRTSTDPVIVYDVVKQLKDHREALMNRNILFAGLPLVESNMATSRYPMHEGARMYQERDRPTFFERYAEVLGLIVTIFTVLASALFGIIQLKSLRSDRRREKYHFKLYDLQRRLEFTYDMPTLLELEKELRALWKEFIAAADKHLIRVDSDFHALRTAMKETEDILYNKKTENADNDDSD